MLEWTEIIASIIATLTAGGWLISRHRRKQEKEEHATKIAGMEAKITASLRDSETKYTREALEIYSENVVKPLRDEIKVIRENQIRFQAAINAAPSCKLFPDCVIVRRLRAQEDTDRDAPDGSQSVE